MNISVIKKNTAFVVFSQFLTIITNIVKTLIIPVIIVSMKMYAFWQIYLFYLSYVLLVSLGFNDGVYLKYTGQDKGKINSNKMLFSSAKFQMIITTLITIVMIGSILLINPAEKKIIYIFICLNLVPMEFIDINLRVYQSKFEMKMFAIFNVIDKVLFIISILVLLFFTKVNCYSLILIDLGIKLVISLCLLIKNRNSWFLRVKSFKGIFKEWLDTSKIGMFVLISSYLLILISGIGRVIIEVFGDIEEYATYSLALSLTNIISLVINSIGIIIFPVFREVGEKKSFLYANKINKVLVALVPLVLLSYYPLSCFIHIYLPSYEASSYYLIYAIPLTIIKCFSSLTYLPLMKSLKKEKQLFINNILSIIIFSSIFIPLYLITKDTNIIVIGTLFATYIELLLNSRTLCFNINDIFVIGGIITLSIVIQILGISVINAILLIAIAVMIYFLNRNEYNSVIKAIFLKNGGK